MNCQEFNFESVLIIVGIIVLLSICYFFGKLASNEAERQGGNETKWFWLGFFFGLRAFIALKGSKVAYNEGHDVNIWTVLVFFFPILSIIALETGITAEKVGRDFDSWVILGFFVGLGALFIACFLKQNETVVNIIKEKENISE